MTPFDPSPFLAPRTPAPAGRDIEATGELNALSDAAKEPEEPGIKGQEAKDERNWRDIKKTAQELLLASAHLRVAGYLARALIHTDGVSAFCGCLGLIAQMLEQGWEQLYPPLDDGDAIERINILRDLASDELLNGLRAAPILSVKGLGNFGIGDVLVAKGLGAPRPGVTPPSPQVVLAALENAPIEELKPVLEASRQAREAVRRVATAISSKAGQPFDLPKLAQLLQRFEEFLGPQVAKHTVLSSPDAGADGQAGPAEAAGVVAGTARPAVPTGEIQTRQEVGQLIDKICRYYERHEPSSPVPLLLQRAKRLATMSFMEIMKDMADKGLPQIEALSGKETKPEKA